jgi:hypothetical protein
VYQHPVTSDQRILSGDWVRNRCPLRERSLRA